MQFQTNLLHTLFDGCKDSSEVVNKGYEKALLLVTNAIDKIMTGEDLEQQDLVISKLLRQDINKYKSLFPHVSAAIQLCHNNNNNNNTGKYPQKGDTIQYIYTNSQHSNPLCRVVVPIEQNVVQTTKPLLEYDKEKYREMIFDAAETVLGIFGFGRTAYYDGGNFSSNKKNRGRQRRKNKWYEELREERMKDIQTEMW
jgi:DNA polymerase elongation subunit (family B)